MELETMDWIIYKQIIFEELNEMVPPEQTILGNLHTRDIWS